MKRKIKIINDKKQGKNILCSILLLSFIFACHYTRKIEGKPQGEKVEACKFDVTRIINIVLDSTNIACLYEFDEDGRFAIYRNDFINKYNVEISSKRYYLSEDCDSLEHSIEARLHKCWFLEFIQFDSISRDTYRLHYALPYKCRGGYYDFNINDYTIVDSFKVKYKAVSDTVRYRIRSKTIKTDGRESNKDSFRVC